MSVGLGCMISEHIPDKCTYRDNKKALSGTTKDIYEDSGLYLIFGYEKPLAEPEKDMKKINTKSNYNSAHKKDGLIPTHGANLLLSVVIIISESIMILIRNNY